MKAFSLFRYFGWHLHHPASENASLAVLCLGMTDCIINEVKKTGVQECYSFKCWNACDT